MKKKTLKIDRKYIVDFKTSYSKRWVEFCELVDCHPLDSPADVLSAIKSQLSIQDDMVKQKKT